MRKPPFDPPYVPGTEPRPRHTPRWVVAAAIGVLLLSLAVILALAAWADVRTPEPAEVVTPSPYGWPAAALVLWPGRRLAAALNRAVYDPNPDGHQCRYCTRDARLAFRANTAASALWQLLTISTYRACWTHWPYAAGDAHRSVKRECLTGLAETGRE